MGFGPISSALKHIESLQHGCGKDALGYHSGGGTPFTITLSSTIPPFHFSSVIQCTYDACVEIRQVKARK
jgi:hypothetical protein